MRALVLTVLFAGVFLAGCTQLSNYGSKDSPIAPPLPFTTPSPTAASANIVEGACAPEGQTLNDAINPYGPTDYLQCCPGLVPDFTSGGEGGTCMKPQDVPTATPTAAPTESGSRVANPASAHCTALGYTEAFQDEGTQCRFSDGSSCDEWDFYRGQCGQAFSACAQAGGDLTAGSSRIGTAFFRFGLCTFDDGSQCGEGELADGKCQAGQCKAWTAQGCKK